MIWWVGHQRTDLVMSDDLKSELDIRIKGRQYASFFEWPDRQIKELGVVRELLTSLNNAANLGLHSPSIYDQDPPDCNCKNREGNNVAIEVTEIVCSEAVRLNAQGQKVYRNWKSGELTTHIEHLLTEKDKKNYHGGPYVSIFACLFTDEPMLTVDFVKAELETVRFGPFSQLTSAFLLFSYDPTSKSYPVIPLNFKT
jgi:hypothetical protein